MDPTGQAVGTNLIDDVLTRLDAEPKVSDQASDLVLGALLGDGELASCLGGTAPPRPDPKAEPPNVEPAHAYLGSITVAGFRGVGPRTELSLHPGPGVTLVVGRNGSGKSSFAEAAEVLFTGDNQRWAKRSAAWKEGWRNLHEPDPCELQSALLVDGAAGMTTVTRRWGSGADLDTSTTVVARPSSPNETIEALGWKNDLVAYRPFLSYNELGSSLEEGPSKLYDAISSVLGLEELVAAQERLRETRLAREKAFKEVSGRVVKLRDQLALLEDDPRATRCATAIATKNWDLDAVDAEATGTESSTNDDVIALLDQVLSLYGPDLDEVSECAEALRSAHAAVQAATGTDAERALRIADLFDQALEVHEHDEGTDCPLCGTAGTFDDAWAERARAELTDLRRAAKTARDARAALATATRTASELISARPPILEQLAESGLDATELIAAWDAWADATDGDDALVLAEHLDAHAVPFTDSVGELRIAAKELRDRFDDDWRPVAETLAAWAGDARGAEAGRLKVAPLKAAEKWLSGAVDVIRDERFQPIADEVNAIWELLRVESNVSLETVKLTGSSTMRRVSLDVSVDGQHGVALGVMSQGELHAMALSLFLPRVMLPGSPFGFVVIDDPVQAMDPARVDGLARVLEYVARRRQVIVFTHDERLPEAMRRLQLNARVIEVIRTSGSVVRVRETRDPASRNIDDARALALTKDLPERPARRVIPVLCRQAIEAVSVDVYRRRRLAKGESHLAVETELEAAQKLFPRLALAFFDDADRAGDVLTRANTYGHWAGDVIQACNRGAHEPYAGDLRGLVNDAERLVEKIQLLT